MNVKWQKLLAREGVDITTISEIDVVFYELIRKFTNRKDELLFTHCYFKHIIHYIGVDQQKLGRLVYQRYFNNPEQIKKYYQRGRILLKEIKLLSNKWKKEIGNNNLLNAYQQFRKQFAEVCRIYSIISWLGIETWQIDFDRLLNEMIARNNLLDRQTDIIFSVYKPWKKTALIEIQEEIARGADWGKLAEEYQFLRSWTLVWYRPITAEWFKDLKSGTDNKWAGLNMEEIVELLKPNNKEKAALNLAPYMVFFKDWRDDLRRHHAFLWSFLFTEIAKSFGIERDDLGYLTLDEIEEMLKNRRCNRKKIERRKIHPVVVTLSKDRGLKMQAIEGKFIKRHEKILQEMDKEKNEQVRGSVAQRGAVRGVVKIMRSYHDIKHVKEGDILVANSTHPNYLPAMKKAVAFVTNEGGMISHAAIIARELKKPCIVGTKIATKVLKDGDWVEVDANKGIVIKLNKI